MVRKRITDRPLQERAIRTQQTLLLAAAAVFERMGYAAATLDEIAQEAGISRGALYFHYPTKGQLALAVVEAHYAQWPRIIDKVEARGLSNLETIRQVILTVADYFRNDQITRGGLRLTNDRHVIEVELPTPFVGWISYMKATLRKGQAAGEVAAGVNCNAAARAIVAGFFGIQEVSDRLHGRKDLRARIVEWWDLMRPGLASDR